MPKLICAEVNENFRNLCRSSCAQVHPCRSSVTRYDLVPATRGAHQVWPAYQNLEFWFHFFRENIFKIFSDFAKSEKYFFLFFWLQKNEVRNKKYFISDFGKWSQKNIKKYFSDLAKSEKYLFLFFWFHFFQIRILIVTLHMCTTCYNSNVHLMSRLKGQLFGGPIMKYECFH